MIINLKIIYIYIQKTNYICYIVNILIKILNKKIILLIQQ